MVHSECEAFDYVRFAPSAGLDGRGREGTEEAWLVLSGEGELLGGEDDPLHVQAGDLVLCPCGAGLRIRSSADSPLEVLLMALLPTSVTEQLPARRPVA
jgi:mannose-6-phosphate isomerase-like protein (cupin superfamily)